MAVNKSWSAWWREFLGHSPDETRKALEILSQRYVEASQQVARFTHHAERMHYPHFRDRLLAIAAEKAKHVEAIAERRAAAFRGADRTSTNAARRATRRRRSLGTNL
jgi:hypothetical protein